MESGVREITRSRSWEDTVHIKKQQERALLSRRKKRPSVSPKSNQWHAKSSTRGHLGSRHPGEALSVPYLATELAGLCRWWSACSCLAKNRLAEKGRGEEGGAQWLSFPLCLVWWVILVSLPTIVSSLYCYLVPQDVLNSLPMW